MASNIAEEKVFTIAEYIEILNAFFKTQAARITGEISECKRAASGHVYFTVKDKESAAVIDAIIWARNYQLCGVTLEVGMEVILTGHPNVYAPSGRLSFVADTVELVGEGALKKAYDELRRALEAEGLFAPERKRVLPDYVQRIGVITSLKGAVIHDFMNNLGRFGFAVAAIDSRVEGAQAAKPLLAAIRQMRGRTAAGGAPADEAIEALVVIRGGGSLESLQAFNNEMLVRELVTFPVPVIAGIGHDQDVPLAALAADFMTSTPTAAANLLNRSWEEAYAKVRQFAAIVGRVEDALRRAKVDIDFALRSVIERTADALRRAQERLTNAERVMRVNDPARQLKLGYSIVRERGKVVKSVRGLKVGGALSLQFSDGVAESTIIALE